MYIIFCLYNRLPQGNYLFHVNRGYPTYTFHFLIFYMAREHSDTPRAVTVSLIYLIIIDSIPTIKNKSYTITHQNSLQLDQKYNFFY